MFRLTSSLRGTFRPAALTFAVASVAVPAILAAERGAAHAQPSPNDGRAAVAALPDTPWVIAHRGASAYAPENTIPAFEKAIEQQATFVEIDIQRTKDGAIVCLHDLTLDRTTNVAQVFPDRARQPAQPDGPRFWLEDFTLEEVRQLDAGRWFGDAFAGTRIPTFAETVAAIRGRTGLYIELKAPERYPGIERELLEELRTHGLATPGAVPGSPILVQSFTVESLETFATFDTGLPIHLLFSGRDAARWLSPDGLARVRTFATGLGPEKAVFSTHSSELREAQRAGLLVTPWTFRVTSAMSRTEVTADMARHYHSYSVDGWITDNPDLAPR